MNLIDRNKSYLYYVFKILKISNEVKAAHVKGIESLKISAMGFNDYFT